MRFKKREYNRVPRKLKKLIPMGVYCYTPIRMDIHAGIFYVKHCPFLKSIKYSEKPDYPYDESDKEFANERIDWCRLTRTSPDDQCKDCGIKYGF